MSASDSGRGLQVKFIYPDNLRPGKLMAIATTQVSSGRNQDFPFDAQAARNILVSLLGDVPGYLALILLQGQYSFLNG